MTAADMWAGVPIANGSRFDAIVVGSGAAGGVAAARLCEAGFKVAVLEAGSLGSRPANPVTRSLTAVARFLEKVEAERRLPPNLARLGERAFRLLGRARQPVQSKCFAWAMAPDLLVDDRDCPYQTEENSEFLWFRSRQPGGRMIVPGHGRQYYRLAGMKLAGSDSNEINWPFGTEDLDEWYGWVEDKLQLKGGAQPLHAPKSSRLADILAPTGSEQAIMGVIQARWPQAQPVLGSFAAPSQWLEQAAGTGRLVCQAGAVVRRVLKDDNGAAEGVEWVDSRTGDVRNAYAPTVFLCASAIESTRILMLSRPTEASSRVGTGSSALGCYLMDHAVMSGHGFRSRLDDVLPEQSEPGRCIHIPPHEALDGSVSLQIHVHSRPGGGARVDIVSFAEMLPNPWNRVTLSPTQRDRYGMPVPVIRFQHSEEQRTKARRQEEIIRQLAADLGLTDLVVNTDLSPGGMSVHECGTARMGTDPATSVVDTNNECWDVPGLYVTDGACFPRQHVHNPTLTIMALTARAAAHAAARQFRSLQAA
ncbi:GMC oxidoreductase [Paracoccus sp. (in: a-proteobacteria)]|uniref:GMC oxidoreductase n=1 Tax=Paracoccus sp. TaxID=267 RepID=UPI00396C4689